MSDWRNTQSMIINKIKQQLYTRKDDQIFAVQRWINHFDPQNTGLLTRYDFEQFLSKIGVYLSTQELRCLYDAYASPGPQNPQKLVSFSLFINNIKAAMNEYRLSLVKNAFQFLDQQRQRKLSLQYLFEKYQASQHPRARTNQKNSKQVFEEFHDAIIQKSSDGQNITEQEFLEYYSDLNLTHTNEKDEYFADLIIQTWGITSGKDYVSQERIADLELILYEKIRQKTTAKTDEGLTALNTFKYFDLTDAGFIDYNQFVRAVQTFGCTFEERELVALFSKFDTDNTGKINYQEFSKLFAGIGSGKIVNVNPIFEKMVQLPFQEIQFVSNFLKSRNQPVKQLETDFTREDKYMRGYLDREQFQIVLQKRYGLVLTKRQNENIYRYFDRQYQDKIDYNEFINVLNSLEQQQQQQ